ncbi:CoA transferase, partial [Rhodococcus sp. IEGM 248]|nr:CoA transferase [Rhodococcus sp. IEGM 248]
TPVLTFAEAPQNPHIAARGSLVELDRVTQHRPAPRFSRSEPGLPGAPVTEAVDTATLWN